MAEAVAITPTARECAGFLLIPGGWGNAGGEVSSHSRVALRNDVR